MVSRLYRFLFFIFVLQMTGCFISMHSLSFGQKLDAFLYEVDIRFSSASSVEKTVVVVGFVDRVSNYLRSDSEFKRDSSYYKDFDWTNQLLSPLLGYVVNIQKQEPTLDASSLGRAINALAGLILQEKVGDVPRSAQVFAEELKRRFKVKKGTSVKSVESAMVDGLLQHLKARLGL